MKLFLLIALLLMIVSVSGCATDGGQCLWDKPIMLSRQDVLTDGTAAQVLAHNEKGAAICGW